MTRLIAPPVAGLFFWAGSCRASSAGRRVLWFHWPTADTTKLATVTSMAAAAMEKTPGPGWSLLARRHGGGGAPASLTFAATVEPIHERLARALSGVPFDPVVVLLRNGWRHIGVLVLCGEVGCTNQNTDDYEELHDAAQPEKSLDYAGWSRLRPLIRTTLDAPQNAITLIDDQSKGQRIVKSRYILPERPSAPRLQGRSACQGR